MNGGEEVARESWLVSMRFSFLPETPAELVVRNPMGIVISFLRTGAKCSVGSMITPSTRWGSSSRSSGVAVGLSDPGPDGLGRRFGTPEPGLRAYVRTEPARPSAVGTPPGTAVCFSTSRIPPPRNRIRCPRTGATSGSVRHSAATGKLGRHLSGQP